MKFDILTLFPDMVRAVLSESIIGRAISSGILTVTVHNIRDYSEDKHRRVDDTPYGGGFGMLMAAPPVYRCWEAVTGGKKPANGKTIYLSPQGKVLTQKKAEELSWLDSLILLCGHYEGIDDRVIEEVVDEEISVGDFILTGGELPACLLVDCVGRLVNGVLSDPECHEIESISCGMLEYPQYTRPPVFHGKEVPDVLQSGNHAEIERWRYLAAVERTKKKRPDLL